MARNSVVTERKEVSVSDFQKEIIRLEGTSENIAGLIYGDSNVGKTLLAGTLPEKTFWLVCEPGFKSAVRLRQKYGKPPHKGARKIADTATALAAVDWLNAKPSGKRYPRYSYLDWIVLDGVSTMQDRFRLAYAAEAFDTKGSRAHRNLPDKPDYFNTQNFLKSWIPMLVDMPVNLLITAHAYRTDNTASGDPLVFPGIQGKDGETSNAISGLMDFTGYYSAKRMKSRRTGQTRVIRRLWFDQPSVEWGGEDTRYVVGDKLDCLGQYIDFPTMPGILGLINGEDEGA